MAFDGEGAEIRVNIFMIHNLMAYTRFYEVSAIRLQRIGE